MHNGSMVELELIYSVVFGSVIAFGLPLNVLALWIFFRHHGLGSPNIVFMVNLAISDLLLVISLPMRLYFYATGTWPFNNMACIWSTMLFRNNFRSSSIFITVISMDRLLAVVYPLKSRHLRTTSKACKAAVVIWLLLLVVNIPESVALLKFLNNHEKPACFEFHTPLDYATEVGVAYFQLVLLFTMLTVNIISTVLVSWTLHKKVNDSARVRNKVKVMLIFAMNLMMFTIFFIPVSLTVFFNDLRPALSCLASVNCCLDPLLYYFSFDGFWKRKEDVDSSTARQ